MRWNCAAGPPLGVLRRQHPPGCCANECKSRHCPTSRPAAQTWRTCYRHYLARSLAGEWDTITDPRRGDRPEYRPERPPGKAGRRAHICITWPHNLAIGPPSTHVSITRDQLFNQGMGVELAIKRLKGTGDWTTAQRRRPGPAYQRPTEQLCPYLHLKLVQRRGLHSPFQSRNPMPEPRQLKI